MILPNLCDQRQFDVQRIELFPIRLRLGGLAFAAVWAAVSPAVAASKPASAADFNPNNDPAAAANPAFAAAEPAEAVSLCRLMYTA